MSYVSDVDDLQGVRLYDAFMAIKPPHLAETDWAVKAGVNRGFFGDLKSKSKNPRRDTVRKLLREIGRTEADLRSDAPQARKAGNRLPAADQPIVRSVDAGEIVGILQLDLSLSMGPGTLIEDFVESEMVSFDAAALRRITRTPSDRLRFVTGIGTSHEPKFQNGDQFLININENQLTRLDGYYWITFDGAHALKRLRPLGNGMIQIVSENPDFGPMDVERSAVRIEGRAIWYARGL